MADVTDIVNAFVHQYYQTFDTNRSALASLYRAESQLSFEGKSFRGPEAIVKKFESLPFKTVQHIITTVDSQVLSSGDSILIFVVGQLKTDDDRPHSFVQTFLLQQFGEALMVLNDIFRLVIHSA